MAISSFSRFPAGARSSILLFGLLSKNCIPFKFEAPRSKLRGIFDRKDFLSVFDSLAIAVQQEKILSITISRLFCQGFGVIPNFS